LANAQMREHVDQSSPRSGSGRFRAAFHGPGGLAFGMLMMTIRRAMTTGCDDEHIAEAGRDAADGAGRQDLPKPGESPGGLSISTPCPACSPETTAQP